MRLLGHAVSWKAMDEITSHAVSWKAMDEIARPCCELKSYE